MKKQAKNKKITLDDLAGIVQRGFVEQGKKTDKKFVEQGKKTDKKIEDLAMMTKRGFDSVNERFNLVDERFNLVDERFEKIDRRFNKIDERLDGMGERLVSLEKGQEEIKLKLDNVAYRFELIELQKRVEILEKALIKK